MPATKEAGSAQDTGGEDSPVISKLRRQVAEAQRKVKATDAARAAERGGRIRAETARVQSETARFSDNEVAVRNAIFGNQQLLERLEGDLAAAIEAGDQAAQVKINRNIGTVTVRLEKTNEQLANIEEVKKQGGPRLTPLLAEGEDPRLAPYPPATREWIKRNPRFLSDQRYQERALALHNLALGVEDLQVESAEYFEYIERGLKKGGGEKRRNEDGRYVRSRNPEDGGGDVDPRDVNDDDVEDFSEDEDDPVSDAGDVSDAHGTGTSGRSHSRAANSGRSGQPHDYQDRSGLSDSEKEAARFSNPELWEKDPNAAEKEYASNKRILVKQGKIGRDTWGRNT